jgi:hypothetical protein
MVRETAGHDVYLPQGRWIDYRTGTLYAGGWHRIEALQIPIVMLVREGAVNPRMQFDWSNAEMVCPPSDNVPHQVDAASRSGFDERSAGGKDGVSLAPLFPAGPLGTYICDEARLRFPF